MQNTNNKDELKQLNPHVTGYYELKDDIRLCKLVRFRALIDDSKSTVMIGLPKENPENVVGMILMLARQKYTKESLVESVNYLFGLMDKTYKNRGDNPKELSVSINEIKCKYGIKEKIDYVSVGEIHIGTQPWGTLKINAHSSTGIKAGKKYESDIFILYTLWFAVHIFKVSDILNLIEELN